MSGDLSKYDVFNSRLLVGASYASNIELPVLESVGYVPSGDLMSFTDARRSRSDISGSCVHFY